MSFIFEKERNVQGEIYTIYKMLHIYRKQEGKEKCAKENTHYLNVHYKMLKTYKGKANTLNI